MNVTQEVTRSVLGIIAEEELAAAIRVTVQTLATWRSEGRGPKYAKLGRSVFYRVSDLHEWIADCMEGVEDQSGDRTHEVPGSHSKPAARAAG